MEKIIARKTKMFDKVDYVFIKFETAWSSNTAFKENVLSFRKNREQITANISGQSSSNTPSAKKKMVLDKLIDLTLLVCNIGIAYASEKKDDELRTQFNFSKSDLKKGLEDEVYQRCMKVAKNATPIINKLLTYNLPADQLDLITKEADKYAKLISLPESVINTSKSLKDDMATFIAECDEI